MDIEKLKYLKTEVKILARQYRVYSQRSDEAEKLWDVLRNGCEFLDEEYDSCKHKLTKPEWACSPDLRRLDRPSSWSKDKK